MENRLPIIALILALAALIFFAIAIKTNNGIFLLLCILSPIVGMVIGIRARCSGRRPIGKLGAILSLLAIILPVIFVLLSIFVFTPAAIAMNM